MPDNISSLLRNPLEVMVLFLSIVNKNAPRLPMSCLPGMLFPIRAEGPPQKYLKLNRKTARAVAAPSSTSRA